MPATSAIRQKLDELVRGWDDIATATPRRYGDLLDEILFHGSARFADYKPCESEGPFVFRLHEWLRNVANSLEKQTLLSSLQWLIFVDEQQMDALYRDAYRRCLRQWLLSADINMAELFDSRYELNLRSRLARVPFMSVTLSFSFPRFTQINELLGLPDPLVIGPDSDHARASLQGNRQFRDAPECIIFEDFVGTGKQASKILHVVREMLRPDVRIAFVPLIALEDGVDCLRREHAPLVDVLPVMTIRKEHCVRPSRSTGEPADFTALRKVVKSTSRRVSLRANDVDDPPASPFGYGKSGALIVTCHNSPNNTLPLIHHRAPSWVPLFRRHHHQQAASRRLYEDGLL